MPRKPRTQNPGGVFHVISRAVDGQVLFRARDDFALFDGLVGQAVERYEWECLTHCYMVNHFHLCLRLRAPTLSEGIQYLKGTYAREYNDRYGRSGALWDARFRSPQFLSDGHLAEAMRYIPLNPVRAGVCATAEDWEWSAHRALAGLAPPGFVNVTAALALFAGDRDRARAEYLRLVNGADANGSRYVTPELKSILADRDIRRALSRAVEAGYGTDELARALQWSRRRVQRGLQAARVAKGV